LDVCDLNGDGKKEIVAATSYHLVIALDAKCNKLWTAYLASPANVLACVRPKGAKQAKIVTASTDGGVRLLDAQGKLIAKGSVPGPSSCIQPLTDSAGNQYVAIATTKGGLSLFGISAKP